MLEALSIRNIVLIDTLHIDFEAGLCVLTGETGAGKSILLDALGLALGARAEGRLLRQGSPQAQVTAFFRLPSSHSLWQKIQDQGIPLGEENVLLFRRLLDADGKSKCFINDQLVSQTLMRSFGQELVEIHGQFDQLLEPKLHLRALDTYGKVDIRPVNEAFKVLFEAQENLKNFKENLAKSFERQTFLRVAIEEIEKASPRLGEEEELETEKALISHQAKIAEALIVVDQSLSPLISSLSQSHKALSRIQEILPDKITPLMEASDRAIVEVQEVLEGVRTVKREVEGTPRNLETLENRLYALKALSRKYQSDNLVLRLKEFKEELLALEQGEDHMQGLEAALQMSKDAYLEKAHSLSSLRQKCAKVLEDAIAHELPPLKLENANFRIHFEEFPEEGWRASGIDRVEFYIQTNPGLPEGPLAEIASGGELSRLMLALKVVLVQAGSVPTLIFDEIESGTGGAVASAMGERLKILAKESQILAITHSPQIASHGNQHMIVFKKITDGNTTTHINSLPIEERYEEIARMLAGQDITQEARAAAKRLMGTER